jgi:hypothetical protein
MRILQQSASPITKEFQKAPSVYVIERVSTSHRGRQFLYRIPAAFRNPFIKLVVTYGETHD